MDQQPSDQIQTELESFRRQWREEVSSRSKNPATVAASSSASQHSKPAVPSSSHKPPRRHGPPLQAKGKPLQNRDKNSQLDDEDDYVPAPVFEGDGPSAKVKVGQTIEHAENAPKTALEFYEEAVERESMGKLGDSLQLYRKALRMDDAVDRKYRDKHFAGRWAKAAQQQQQQQQQQPPPPPPSLQPLVQQVNPSTSAATVQNIAPQPQTGAARDDPVIPLSFPDLIASFAGLKLEGAPPPCEGVEPPPCPISTLPDEILVHILCDVAVADVADFMRLAQVCKRLAYIVLTEDHIWRRICVGPEFGFGGIHQYYQRSVTWEPLTVTLSSAFSGMDAGANGGMTATIAAATELGVDTDVDPEAELYQPEDLQRRRTAQNLQATLDLFASRAYPSWQSMFRRRPRVRFGGCYISTVNYIRQGQNAGQHLTWGPPVHIVTYYRYLRLFRDGTVISLTTTDEPAHVVHQLKRENMPTRRGNAHHHHHSHHPPSSTNSNVMSVALKGRWRLSSSPSTTTPEDSTRNTNTKLENSEGDLYIETEGVGPKYIYRMDLSLRSAGRAAARNNKLIWRGFWCYNKLTDDWAEFALKNDKPFFFSRVRSYDIWD